MISTIRYGLLSALLIVTLSPAAEARNMDEYRVFSQPELDQLLAPVALYPDTVLSHLLIAATYPLEVVQAARWSRKHPDLRGEIAVEAVIDYPWDPSVMALVAFPELLDRMDADLDWTQRLGDAFLIQEEAVLESIQHLRAQAHRAGHLASNEQVRVVREREVIYIEPARRQLIYLPYYQPAVVYGHWRWADYPPVAWYHPRRPRYSVALYWSPGYRVAPTFFFSAFHWAQRQVVVVQHHHHYYRPSHYPRPRTVVHQHVFSGRALARHDTAQRWTHAPAHRRGVAYRAAVAERHRQAIDRSDRSPTFSGGQSQAAVVRAPETRSRQRQWAAQRRSEVTRQVRPAAQARPGRPATLQRNLEARPNARLQTREPSMAAPNRALSVERRRIERSSGAASSVRSTAPAASRSAPAPHAAMPRASSSRPSAPARASQRLPSSTIRATGHAREAARPAASSERSVVRRAAPPPSRSAAGARASSERSAIRSSARVQHSQATSRSGERSATRRRD
ncbi:MAG: DUF3300 domain-containing protein [Wenzhouxiangella sp.]